MDDSNARRMMRRHLAFTKRIRDLDHRRDSGDFAEGRLRDFAERIKDLIWLRDEAPEDTATLNGLITVSFKLLIMKRKEFNLPVLHGDDLEQDLPDEGGTGVPAPAHTGPLTLTGAGGRLFSESEECNDW